jgi:Large polyvalent protein associated domain 22
MANEYDDYFNESRQQALTSIVAPADEDDPEKAARAISLGQTTGVAPELIYPNVENFEKQHRAVLDSDLITKNSKLQSYLNSDPMAAKVSQDDIGHLDQVSELLHQFGYESHDDAHSWLKSNSIQQGFQRGFGDQPFGQMFVPKGFARDPNPIMDAWWQLSEGVARAESTGAEIPLRLFNGLVFATTQGLLGEDTGDKLAQMMLDPGLQASISGVGPHGALMASALAGWGRLSGYLRAGRMPPTGVHPAIDTIYKEAAERDAKQLDELVKESSANATRERSPEYYSKFVDHQVPDGPKIKVDASAIARLYGDKPPEADDNILGWVPNLAERLDTTAGSGGYIEIPLKDWLAHVDPEVHKELRDDILIRDHGFTVNETKEIPDWKLEVTEAQKVDIDAKKPTQPPPLPPDPARTLPGPTQVVRGAAGLEPLFSVGDRKITLQRMAKPDHPEFGPDKGFHDLDILDQDGNRVGVINISEQNAGKQLYIDNIQAGKNKTMFDPNFLGPALTRDLLRQLKKEFPDAESITGHRAGGARYKDKPDDYLPPSDIAMPVVKFDLGPDDIQSFRDLLSRHWEDVGSDVSALFRTDERGLAADSPLGQMVIAEMRRISPHTEIDAAHDLSFEGRSLQGVYLPLTKEVIVSLNAKDPIGTARHESIHALRRLRMFTEDEWSTLESAVLENKWEEKYDIGVRYPDLGRGPKIEEAIAEAYGHWRAGEAVPDKVHTLFERIKSFFEGLLKRVGDHLGLRADSWEEIFQKIDSGEVGNRDLIAEDGGKVEPKFQEGDEAPEPQQITLPFGEGKAIGLRQDIYQRYMRLIRQKHEADLKADFGDALAKEKRTQSREWREASVTIREQVEASIDERPNILVDRLLSERAGEFKIDPVSLREDLREVLPKEYMRKTNSMSADDIAGYFGYPSGDALVEHLAQITEDRKASGLSHAEYVKKLVNDEVQRQMEAQFGFLEKNILEEAKDRALSDNQIAIIEEEVLALAEQAKQAVPIQRGAILSKLRESFSDTPVGSISSDLYLKASGKAGRETEEALLKSDYQEAFQAKQRQWLAVTQAKWAHAYEKQRSQLDKTAKQWSKKEAHLKKEVAPEFVNHLQDQLRRAGYPGSRSLENIRENLAGQTIEQFAEEHLAGSYGLRDLPIAEFALDPSWAKPVDALTHEQFSQFKGMIDSLVKNGRDIYKFGKVGDKADLETAIADFRQGIAQGEGMLPEYGDRPGVLRTFAARLTSMPTVFNLFDRLDRSGPWNGLARRFLDQDAESIAFSKEVERAWKEVSDYGDLSKKLAPPPMMPKWNERYASFTRQNLLGMIQNAGNRSNWFKLARGWDVEPELAGWGDTKPGTLWSWMVENSLPEDWARAQAMGDKIFRKVVERTDRVEENVNGYTLDKLPLEAMEVDHGEGPQAFKGWYHPLIPDQIWYAEKGAKKGVYNDSPFGHIMTSNGYTRTRTGAVYPVDLGYAMLPARIGQMIHDITHRELILDAQKVMLDARVKNDITKYWGKEYTDLMEPYLREMAGQAQMPSANMARMEAASEFMRQNTMTTYIGFNPSTPMKHFPTAFFQSLRDGKGYFLKAYMQQWMGVRPNEGNYWGSYAMEHSEVLQGRDRHWREALGNNLEFPKADFDFTNWRDWRNEASRWGSKVVAWSDMASAKSLWIGQYQRYLAEGVNARDSISRANQDVIRQHGALLLSNKPEIVRQSGNLHGWMTSVYGFMGERMQRLREMGYRMNDTYGLMKEGEYQKATANLPAIAADYLTYVVQVGLWEEAATMALSSDHKSMGLRLFDLAFGNIASSIIYARDIWHAAETGQDPGTGLLTSAASDLNRVVRDLFKGKDAFSRQHAGKTLRDIITMGGITTGITPRAIGNVIKFSTDVYNRQQYPKDVVDWFRGLAKGQMPKKEAKK